MRGKRIALRGLSVLLLTFVMLAAVMVGAMASGIARAAETDLGAQAAGGASQEQTLAWLLLVSFLEAVVLGYLVLRSQGRGLKLAGALFLAMFGLNTVLPHIESLIFLEQRLPPGFIPKMVLMGLVQAAVFAPAAVWILGRGSRQPDREAAIGPAPVRASATPEWRDWAWKLPLMALVYVALYLTFGYYVAWKEPLVREYYGGTDPGSFYLQLASMFHSQPWFFLVQLGRGLLWVLFTLPLIRSLAVRRWELPLAVALLFAVWSFVLLMPNPLMPEAVARVHLVETLGSNFLFGAFVGWLLLASAARPRLAARPAAVRQARSLEGEGHA